MRMTQHMIEPFDDMQTIAPGIHGYQSPWSFEATQKTNDHKHQPFKAMVCLGIAFKDFFSDYWHPPAG